MYIFVKFMKIFVPQRFIGNIDEMGLVPAASLSAEPLYPLIVNLTWVPTPAGTTPAAHSKEPIKTKTASAEYHRWSWTTLKTPIFKMRSSPTVPQNWFSILGWNSWTYKNLLIYQ